MIEFNLEEISQKKFYKIENRVLNSCYTEKKSCQTRNSEPNKTVIHKLRDKTLEERLKKREHIFTWPLP